MKKFISLFTLGALLSTAQAAFINDKAPEFTLTDIKGVNRALKDFQGDIVFVNFWASWCPPCKQEFPEINELANEYKNQGVSVLAINLDKSPDRVSAFMEKTGVNPDALHILLDPKAEVVAQYVARSMPTSFVVDGKGIIRFVHFGYSEKDPVKWRTEIDSLLVEIKKPASTKTKPKRSAP